MKGVSNSARITGASVGESPKEISKKAPEKGALNGRTLAGGKDRAGKPLWVPPRPKSEKTLEQVAVWNTPSKSEREITANNTGNIRPASMPSLLAKDAENDGWMSDSDFKKAKAFVQHINVKYGEQVAKVVARNILATADDKKFTPSRAERMEGAAGLLHSRIQKEKNEFVASKREHIKTFYEQHGIDTSNKNVSLYAERAVEKAVFADKPLSGNRRKVINDQLRALLAGSTGNPLASSRHQGAPPLLNGPMASGEVSMEDPAQFAEMVQRYASRLCSQISDSPDKPSCKNALEALVWKCDELRSGISRSNGSSEWADIRADLDSLLSMKGSEVTEYQRETLSVLRARVNEKALVSVCEDFKSTLREQLKGLDDNGAVKKAHVGFALGVSGGFADLLEFGGAELRVGYDVSFSNDGYGINEEKGASGGLILYAGDKKLARAVADSKAVQSTVRTYANVDELIDFHANDLYAVLLPLSLGNHKGTQLVQEHQKGMAARAADRDVIYDRLAQQGILTSRTTLSSAEFSKKMPAESHVRMYVDTLAVAGNKTTDSVSHVTVKLPRALQAHVKSHPETIQQAKESYFITEGESDVYGSVRDKVNDYLTHFKEMDSMLGKQTNAHVQNYLELTRAELQQDVASFCSNIAESELAALEMYTHVVNLQDSELTQSKDASVQDGLRELKHSMEQAKGASGRAEYMRAALFLSKSLGQLQPLLDVNQGRDALHALESLRSKVINPGMFIPHSEKNNALLQHVDETNAKISMHKDEAVISIPKSTHSFTAASTRTMKEDLSPDRDGVTNQIEVTVPFGSIRESFVTALDTQFLAKHGISISELAQEMGVATVGGKPVQAEDVAIHLANLAEQAGDLKSKEKVRFDLNLINQNDKWRMGYLGVMQDTDYHAEPSKGISVGPGISVKPKLELGVAGSSQKAIQLGTETLHYIKSRYTSFKNMDKADSRWKEFTTRHETEFKRLLLGMKEPDSQVRAEAAEMLDKAKSLGILAEKGLSRTRFLQRLDNSARTFSASGSDKDFQHALRNVSELLAVNSEVYAHEMNELINAQINNTAEIQR